MTGRPLLARPRLHAPMALSVNTNLASLAARHAQDAAASALQKTVQRLSSGLRVNSARDDAAGLAIAERWTSRLRGGQQAARNVNDGLSLLHTADGALGVMSERLQRMREQVVQAMNGSNGQADRASLDNDVQQQRAELDRIAAATRFNGRALLDGSVGMALFQVGAGSADTLALALDTSMRSADLGAIASAISGDLRSLSDGSGGYPFAATYTTVPITALDFSRPAVAFAPGSSRTTAAPPTDYSAGAAAQFTVDGRTVNLTADYGSLAGVVGAVQSQLDSAAPGDYVVAQDSGRVRITKTAAASNNTVPPAVEAVSGAGAAIFAASTGSAGNKASATTRASFTVDNRRVTLVADHSGDFSALVADIQAQLDASARGAYRVSGSEAGLSITRVVGTEAPVLANFQDAGASVFAAGPRSGVTLKPGALSVQVGTRPAVAVTGTFATPQALAAAVAQQVGGGITTVINASTGALEISARETLTLSGSAAEPGGSLSFMALVNPATGSLNDVDASGADTARRALLRIDAAIDQISSQRSLYGALQSRFEAVAAGLLVDTTLAAASRSRIVDADFAAETAALSRQQVLQQAALAMLAQANVQPRDVLSLMPRP